MGTPQLPQVPPMSRPVTSTRTAAVEGLPAAESRGISAMRATKSTVSGIIRMLLRPYVSETPAKSGLRNMPENDQKLMMRVVIRAWAAKSPAKYSSQNWLLP